MLVFLKLYINYLVGYKPDCETRSSITRKLHRFYLSLLDYKFNAVEIAMVYLKVIIYSKIFIEHNFVYLITD